MPNQDDKKGVWSTLDGCRINDRAALTARDSMEITQASSAFRLVYSGRIPERVHRLKKRVTGG